MTSERWRLRILRASRLVCPRARARSKSAWARGSQRRVPLCLLVVATLRAFLSTRARLRAASRARTHAALASFLAWAYRHGHIDADPMARIERVRVPAPTPRGLAVAQVQKILAVIPRTPTSATDCCSG